MDERWQIALETFAVQMRTLAHGRGESIAELVERRLKQIPSQAAEEARRWADPLAFVEVMGRQFRKTEALGRCMFTTYLLATLMTDLWKWYRDDEEIAPYLPTPFQRDRFMAVN